MRFEGGKGGGDGVAIHITPQISIFGCANYSASQKNNSFLQQDQMKLAVDQNIAFDAGMAPPLLVLQGIGLTLGGKPLIESADLSVERGDRLCLVGRNGSGKSTLLKIAAGEIEADHGLRFFQPDATVRYLPQEPDLAGFETMS